MKDDEVIEFIEYNNNNSEFEIEIKSKVLYVNFIIMKFINYDFC